MIKVIEVMKNIKKKKKRKAKRKRKRRKGITIIIINDFKLNKVLFQFY